MKTKTIKILALSALAFYGLSACDKHKDNDHAGQDHDHDKAEAASPVADTEDKDHDHDHDHGDEIVAGPSGGRVLTKVEPHLEFFVNAERKVEIRQLTEELKAEPIGTQVVSLVAGDRANPTMLTMIKSGDMLVSETALPEGNDFPLVIEIKASAEDTDKKREKFNLNLADCPNCDNKEYACTCDHGDDE